MTLTELKELYNKVNDGSVDRETAAEATINLARMTLNGMKKNYLKKRQQRKQERRLRVKCFSLLDK